MHRLRVPLLLLISASPFASDLSSAGTQNPACRAEPIEYKGWHAQQLSNRWVRLIVVPQNGGRLMQVMFGGHPYLFVNPQYAGKYLPPTQGKWFNYGGDKLWPLPEGTEDEQHWAGGSDLLDDAPYTFQVISEAQHCAIALTGPSDPQTGLQFMRTISLDSDSPEIRFHAVMKNSSAHAIEWSVQSVSQYDTADPHDASKYNHEFRAYAPVNPQSSYLDHYHVRFGPAENPLVRIRKDSLFALHYGYLAAELWLDSTAGWLAVVDGSSAYAMLERSSYRAGMQYPGKASVIFWTNGPQLRLDGQGVPLISPGDPGETPFYMEAELNSPLVRLGPGESYAFDTEWFPTRGGRQFVTASDAGIVVQTPRAIPSADGGLKLTGSFGVFFSGRLVGRIYGGAGQLMQVVPLTDVDPLDRVDLEKTIRITGQPARVSIRLEDTNGADRGSFGEVRVQRDDVELEDER